MNVTIGSFECVCREGYSGSGIKCKNINECKTGTPWLNYAICFAFFS